MPPPRSSGAKAPPPPGKEPDPTVVMDHTQAPGADLPPAAGGWYAGIGGEPVGPVDLDYLQGEIDSGRVSDKTLVWREGQGDWKPLNNFPELRALVAKKKTASVPEPGTSAPLALTKPKDAPPSPSASATPSGALSTQAMNPFDRAKVEKKSQAEDEEKRASLAALAAGATVKSDGPPPAVLEAASDPSAQPPASAMPAAGVSATVAGPTSAATGSAQAATATPSATTGLGPEPVPLAGGSSPQPEPGSMDALAAEMGVDTAAKGGAIPVSELTPAWIPAERKRNIHPMAWAFVAMAAAFGAVSAWFLFGQTDEGDETADPADPAPRASGPSGGQEVGSDGRVGGEPNPEPGAGDAAEDDGSSKSGAVAHNSPAGGGTPPRSTGSGSSRAADDDGGKADPGSGKATPKPCSPDDPFCSPNVDGPSAGNGDSGSGDAGAGLSPAQAQSTVGRYRGSLMRRCRSLVVAGKSATVGASITIGPSGAVQSVGVSGGKGHPGLASCVRSRIQNWRFPASGGTSTVNVSFKFL